MRSLFALCGLAFSLVIIAPAWGRSLAVPPPAPVDFVLEKITLDAVIDGQKASCTLKYVLHNPGNSPLEVDFLAPLPEGGTVTGVTLSDGSNELPGNIYGKKEAWEIYRRIAAQMRDPALLEYAGRDTFRARVFPIPAGGSQTLELSFNFLTVKRDGRLAFTFPLAGPMTADRQPEQQVHVVIRQREGLGNIYSPLAGVKIDRPQGGDAVASFELEKAPVINDFALYYQNDAGEVGGMVLSHKPDDEDGYFIFLADPVFSDQPIQAKNVVFVLDKSGSMNGPKFAQAREALRYVLDRLEEKDNFGLIDYNQEISAWQPEMAAMNEENRRSAALYVDNLRSGGNTNIEAALSAGFKMFGDPTTPNYLIFLTDGQPTEGERREIPLAQKAEKIQNSARLFAFGLGHDVNARLLDRLSGQSGGTSVFVRPEQNIEEAVSSFFDLLTAPSLIRPELESTRPLNRVLPETLPDLFLGRQLVVTGRYRQGGEAVITLRGRRGDEMEEFQYRVQLTDQAEPGGQFISQLWAQRRIAWIIDRIDLAGGRPDPKLVEELTDLSRRYGILTPYTSFLALEDQSITDQQELASRAAENLTIINQTVGAEANAQRSLKAEMMNAAAPAMAAPPKKHQSPKSQDEILKMVKMDRAVQKRIEEAPKNQGNEGAGAEKKLAARFSFPAQWAGRTFFFKNGQWQESLLESDDIKKAKRIEQMSDQYFKLAEEMKPEEMVWLTQKEPVIFKREGTIYLIEPAAPDHPPLAAKD